MLTNAHDARITIRTIVVGRALRGDDPKSTAPRWRSSTAHSSRAIRVSSARDTVGLLAPHAGQAHPAPPSAARWVAVGVGVRQEALAPNAYSARTRQAIAVLFALVRHWLSHAVAIASRRSLAALAAFTIAVVATLTRRRHVGRRAGLGCCGIGNEREARNYEHKEDAKRSHATENTPLLARGTLRAAAPLTSRVAAGTRRARSPWPWPR